MVAIIAVVIVGAVEVLVGFGVVGANAVHVVVVAVVVVVVGIVIVFR